MKGIAIIAAAGKGERAGVDKVWTKMGGKLVLERATEPFLSSATVDAVVIAVAAEHESEAKALFAGAEKPCAVVVGGSSRTESVRKALEKAALLAGEEDAVVAVHDGARPYVTQRLIEECMTVAAAKGSAVPVLSSTDSVRLLSEGGSRAVPRESVLRVQTPQCFSLQALRKAYSVMKEATDDATIYEQAFGAVTLVDGDPKNEKITYLSDIYKESSQRVGVGYDVHPLAAGRPLVLGGTLIPNDKGLVGHSDADVLVHAIMDALLTAAALPDIGHFFPPDDPKYEGADSTGLLKTVMEKISEKGYEVGNVSATILAEKPKLAPFLPVMEKRIADVMGCRDDAVKFAATTTEKLGIIGEEKGMAAYAVALLVKKD